MIFLLLAVNISGGFLLDHGRQFGWYQGMPLEFGIRKKINAKVIWKYLKGLQNKLLDAYYKWFLLFHFFRYLVFKLQCR